MRTTGLPAGTHSSSRKNVSETKSGLRRRAACLIDAPGGTAQRGVGGRDLRTLRAYLVFSRGQARNIELLGKLAHPGGLDGLVGARIVELCPGYAARLELRFVALQLLCCLFLGCFRLRKLRLHHREFGTALADLQIGKLRPRRIELLVGLLLGSGFLLGVELEEASVGGDGLPALDKQLLEATRDGRGNIDVLRLDVALVATGLLA